MMLEIVLPDFKRLSVELESKIFVYEVVEDLINKGILKTDHCLLVVKKSDDKHSALKMNTTLEQNEIFENDTLLVTETGLGGYPTLRLNIELPSGTCIDSYHAAFAPAYSVIEYLLHSGHMEPLIDSESEQYVLYYRTEKSSIIVLDMEKTLEENDIQDSVHLLVGISKMPNTALRQQTTIDTIPPKMDWLEYEVTTYMPDESEFEYDPSKRNPIINIRVLLPSMRYEFIKTRMRLSGSELVERLVNEGKLEPMQDSKDTYVLAMPAPVLRILDMDKSLWDNNVEENGMLLVLRESEESRINRIEYANKLLTLDVQLSSGESFTIEVPNGIYVYEIIDQMIEYKVLSPSNKHYIIYNSEHKELNMSTTIGDNSIKNHDLLLISALGY